MNMKKTSGESEPETTENGAVQSATGSHPETMPSPNRPRTRRFIQEEERLKREKEAKENEPRRSSRDHNCIRFKSSEAFHRKLNSLFFEPASRTNWKSVGSSRLHIRRVHKSPHIYEIDNFLSETELDYFSQVITSCSFQKSFVDNMEFDGEETAGQAEGPNPKRRRRTILDTSHRTSTFFGFKHRADSTIRAIEQRTADLLGCWVHQIEGLQLVRYLPGQFFGVHHDLGDLLSDDRVLLPRKQFAMKRRLVTIFVYLNDLDKDQGGCTYFPKCGGLRVRPKRGKAVLWSNITADGYPDPNTIHAGEAVHATTGDKNVVKYGLNVWITEE